MANEIKFNVNGIARITHNGQEETLLHFLREKIGLRATRFGCGQGTCGSCMVIIDGQPKMACETSTDGLAGKNIQTAESLTEELIHPLIMTFQEYQAGQCGYCLPGILMTSKALLDENPNRTREEIAEALDSNLCRCGAHSRILDAVQKAASILKEVEQV